MSIVDWSKAPEGATHHIRDIDGYVGSSFAIELDDRYQDIDSCGYLMKKDVDNGWSVTARPKPEQIAKERESAVLEMLDHFRLGSDKQELLRAVCFALYDAGYRKVTP